MRARDAAGWRRSLLLTACPLALALASGPAFAQSSTGTPGAAGTTTGTSTTAPAKKPHHHPARKPGRHVAAKGASKPGAVAGGAAAAGVVMPTAVTATPAQPALAGTGGGAAASGAAESGETVIVTGTRNLNTKARDSTSPIRVISAATLQRSGQPNLVDQLTRTDPSLSTQPEGADTQALTSSIQLRGLSSNQVLVLIDGIRRHETSNIVADAGPEQGSTPVDINLIPAAAIDHIEVLADGAAAQYGSDAIAGVVNVIMKKTDTGGTYTAFTGALPYSGDGWTYQLDADQGASFGNDGYVHLGGQVYHTDFFVAKTYDDRAPLGGFPANSNQINGLPEETRETLSIEFGETLLPQLFGGVKGYGLITYGHRHGESYENYRTPTVLPEVYPAGFSPLETDEENDFAATLGVKADDFFGFHVDLSSTYGEDETDIGNKNTANPNLYRTGTPALDGYPSNFTPTTVLAQTQQNAQWTNDLDFVKPMTLLGRPTNLAFGAEERAEVFKLGAGAPASAVLGGTQGFAGLLPANAGGWARDVWAAYIDYDIKPIDRLDVDLAGRFEHYTDFGNTYTGKISTRYDFTRWFAIRGTVSNGFRAPTLAEEHFSALNVSPTGASGDLAVNSAAAASIGAVPLKPERSTNASAGIVLQPLPALSVTADVYQINIRDRIVGAGGVNGQPALNAIALTGATLPADIQSNDVSADYFANGLSTRTQGLDVTGNYRSDFHQYGTVNWTVALNLNRTVADHVGTDAFGNPFLTAQGVGYYTEATPRSKLILNAYWKIDKFDVNVRQTRWGQTKDLITYEDQAPAAIEFSNTTFLQFVNTPRWLTDLEVGYQLTRHLHLAVGANNIADIRPRRLPADASYLGVGYYDTGSEQVPISGGFYYGRLNYTF